MPGHRWITGPITGLWYGASAVERRLGIGATLLLGLGLMLAATILNVTLVGMLAGIPAFLFGGALVLRALY